MDLQDIAKERLKEKGLRCTDARLSIYLEFLQRKRPLSINDFKEKKAFEAFDESSLYRNFKKLEESGLINLIPGAGDFQFYEVQHTGHHDHHHHITCTKCKSITCLDDCSVESQLTKMAATVGFNLQGHKLELYGLCKDCNSKKKS